MQSRMHMVPYTVGSGWQTQVPPSTSSSGEPLHWVALEALASGSKVINNNKHGKSISIALTIVCSEMMTWFVNAFT